VQTAITLFTLTMAALMIPGSKLTDIWGRKRCFVLGLAVYAGGGLLAAQAAWAPLPGRCRAADRRAHDSRLRARRHPDAVGRPGMATDCVHIRHISFICILRI
jgi:MFS family permease